MLDSCRVSAVGGGGPLALAIIVPLVRMVVLAGFKVEEGCMWYVISADILPAHLFSMRSASASVLPGAHY